jgi:DNA repair protein RecO (recombination protein O)
MSIQRTQGIVLRSRKVRESSKIVVFYTHDYGKVSTIAKGSRKPKSKFGSSLELFTRSSIIFYRRENRDLHTLSHTDIIETYDGLKEDVVKVAYASVAGEMVERLAAVEETNKGIFALLESFLREIAIADRGQLEIILSSYELKMLQLIGYGPELVNCVRCGKSMGDQVWFGLVSGGALCPACYGKDLNAVKISPGALDLLREYAEKPMDKLRKEHTADEISRQAADVLNSFVRLQVGESAMLRSMDFLERIRDGGIGL